MNELTWTGERLITQIVNNYGTIEHLHRYAIAKQFAQDKIILDIASGEGYGSNLLSENAKFVFGVDIDEEAVNFANRKYKKDNLNYKVGSASEIPLDDNSVDLIISFETIEHHTKHKEMMLEFKRVLKSDGLIILSSPEKSIYKERDPDNPFHVKELTLTELKKLTSSYFKYSSFSKQFYFTGSVIIPFEEQISSSIKTFDGNYTRISDTLEEKNFYNKPYFNIALLCNDIQKYDNSVANIASIFNGYNVYEQQIVDLEKRIRNAYSSTTFKVGNIILTPLKFLKRIFK